MKSREEIIKEIEAEVREHCIYADIEAHHTLPIVIDADVVGDWKHDHLALKNIFEKHGCKKISEQVLEDTEEDYYHSIHHYIIYEEASE